MKKKEITIRNYQQLIDFIEESDYSIMQYKEVIARYLMAKVLWHDKKNLTKEALIKALENYEPFYKMGCAIPINGETMPDIGSRKTNPKNK